MNKIAGLAAGLRLATATFDAHAADAALRNDIAADYRERLGALFEHFHRNPELSGREVETSKRLAAEMRALGYEVTEGVGGTGIVAVLRNGAGPTVLLRADMDGLPVEEKSGLPYASTARQVDIDRRRAARHARVRPRRAHDGARRHGAPARRAQEPRGPARSC